jgi:hypothetical protein
MLFGFEVKIQTAVVVVGCLEEDNVYREVGSDVSHEDVEGRKWCTCTI